jgi:hypothetical protein
VLLGTESDFPRQMAGAESHFLSFMAAWSGLPGSSQRA